jgi:anti-anti-sigma factor
MTRHFHVQIVNRNGRATVFVTGELDWTVGRRFADALHAAFNEATDVIVDLTGVTLIGSTGISRLLQARKVVADCSRLQVVGARPSVRRAFEISGVADLLLGEPPVLTWRQVTYHRSGWRQWMTDDRSEAGVPVAEIIEVGPWAGPGTGDAHYLLEMSGRAVLYGSLSDAMKAAEDPDSAVARPVPQPKSA